jgi:hypothetical protein
MSMDHVLPASAAQPDSQFLPSTKVQYAWDSVSLTNILACPRRYKYSIIEGYVPKAPAFAIALVFGILFHKGLEFYHVARAKGADHDEAIKLAVTQVAALPATVTLPTDDDVDEMAAAHDPDEDSPITLRNSKVRTRYYLFRALVWYMEHYRDDPVTTLIGVTGSPACELSFRIPLELPGIEHPILLCGHIDRGVEFQGSLYASDYKTSKALDRSFFDSFELSHQMSGYIVAGSVIFDRPVSGALIDGVALQVGGVKLGRATTRRTPGQVGEYLRTLTYAAKQAKQHHDEDNYPMNTSACFFCEFKEVCKQAPEYRQRTLEMLYERKRGWNPLENR